MRIPLTKFEIYSIIDGLYEDAAELTDCDKCRKWSSKMRKDLKDGNFDYFKHDVMHFVNHIQDENKVRKRELKREGF